MEGSGSVPVLIGAIVNVNDVEAKHPHSHSHSHSHSHPQLHSHTANRVFEIFASRHTSQIIRTRLQYITPRFAKPVESRDVMPFSHMITTEIVHRIEFIWCNFVSNLISKTKLNSSIPFYISSFEACALAK